MRRCGAVASLSVLPARQFCSKLPLGCCVECAVPMLPHAACVNGSLFFVWLRRTGCSRSTTRRLFRWPIYVRVLWKQISTSAPSDTAVTPFILHSCCSSCAPLPPLVFILTILAAVGDFKRRSVGCFWRGLRVYGTATLGVTGRAGVAAAHLAGAQLLEHCT